MPVFNEYLEISSVKNQVVKTVLQNWIPEITGVEIEFSIKEYSAEPPEVKSVEILQVIVDDEMMSNDLSAMDIPAEVVDILEHVCLYRCKDNPSLLERQRQRDIDLYADTEMERKDGF